ncbi:hypothetical protein JCM24511_09572 [Saitozyma sp. JCM 24511]|nr:hypothetical protein JCM24511_09572 [Saitozyma sp. JCM 24511]
MSAPHPSPQSVGYSRSLPFQSLETARRWPLLICYPTERCLKRAHSSESSEVAGDVVSADQTSPPTDQADSPPAKKSKDEEDVSRLPHSPSASSLSTSSERAPAVHSPPGISSPRHSHDTPLPSSPAADSGPISDQDPQDGAELRTPEVSIEEEASSLPSDEEANDNGTAATEENDRWDDHFCDPDAKIIIRSNDGSKFRMSAWYLGRASWASCSEVFAAMFATSALTADKPIDIDACQTVVRALLEVTYLTFSNGRTKFDFYELDPAHLLQLKDLADMYDFATIKKEARGDLEMAIECILGLDFDHFEPKRHPQLEGMNDVWLSKLTHYFTMPKYHSPWKESDGTMTACVMSEQRQEIARLFRKDMEALDRTQEQAEYGMAQVLPQTDLDEDVGSLLVVENKSSCCRLD